MPSKNKIILSFDLDFTLINNKDGIINSFNYTISKFNLPRLKESEIVRMIGIPLTEMFQKITNIDSNDLVVTFREYYRTKGIYQATLLPGIREKLQELKENSFTLGVITSKKQEMADKVIDILGISHFFNYIIGDGKIMKSKLDPNLINYLKKEYPEYYFVIIGDHPKDRALAENLKAPFIGVLTGNHSAEELRLNSSTKTLILSSVKELHPNIIYSLI
ncbi:MAG: HAD family hydrolase [Candidatus Lokiarchaeota archaeon]|nr:HAD family hydrolase [Candidatus Lokiarchaeota archaeon]